MNYREFKRNQFYITKKLSFTGYLRLKKRIVLNMLPKQGKWCPNPMQTTIKKQYKNHQKAQIRVINQFFDTFFRSPLVSSSQKSHISQAAEQDLKWEGEEAKGVKNECIFMYSNESSMPFKQSASMVMPQIEQIELDKKIENLSTQEFHDLYCSTMFLDQMNSDVQEVSEVKVVLGQENNYPLLCMNSSDWEKQFKTLFRRTFYL